MVEIRTVIPSQEPAGELRRPSHACSKREASSIVLGLGNELIGFSSTIGNDEKQNLLVNWIGIHTTWRRRGYASFLLRHILSIAASEGYETASLSSDARTAASMALYQNEGWEVEGGERQFVKHLG